jgi:hypothetical protein
MNRHFVALLAAITAATASTRAADDQVAPDRQIVLPSAPVTASLADLSAKLGARVDNTGQTRRYTNADLVMRTAPVRPETPPFPDIAPPSWILERKHEPTPVVVDSPMTRGLVGFSVFDAAFGFGNPPERNGFNSVNQFSSTRGTPTLAPNVNIVKPANLGRPGNLVRP